MLVVVVSSCKIIQTSLIIITIIIVIIIIIRRIMDLRMLSALIIFHYKFFQVLKYFYTNQSKNLFFLSLVS